MSCCSCIHYCRWILQSLETQHTESFLLLCCIYSLLAGLFKLPIGCPRHGEQHLHSFDRARHYYQVIKQMLSATSVGATVLYRCHSDLMCLFGFQLGDCVSIQWYIYFFCNNFFLPTALQLQSIRVCKKTFRRILVWMCLVQRISSSDSGEDSSKSDDTGTANTQVVIHSLQLTQPWNESSLYMTPYSSKVFSQCPLLCQS